MAWKASKRLIELSRTHQHDDDTDKGKSSTANSFELPNDKVSAAIRSQQVFHELATTPFHSHYNEPRIDASHMKEAMEMCGLDGNKCGRMYEVSKWVKTDIKDTMLDLAEFQMIIERFSSPARLQKQLRQKVDDYMKEHNLEFVYTVDHILQTDNLHACEIKPKTSRMTLRSIKQAEIKNWDEVLDGLADL